MVALRRRDADYEFVIWLSAGARIGRAKFVSWSVDKAGPNNQTKKEHAMNTRTLIACATLALTFAGGAYAQEATVEPAATLANSSVSRAAVLADAKLALSSGALHEVAQIHANGDFQSTLSRADVIADTRQALASGEIARLNREATVPTGSNPHAHMAGHHMAMMKH